MTARRRSLQCHNKKWTVQTYRGAKCVSKVEFPTYEMAREHVLAETAKDIQLT